jgi:hypothetical protein
MRRRSSRRGRRTSNRLRPNSWPWHKQVDFSIEVDGERLTLDKYIRQLWSVARSSVASAKRALENHEMPSDVRERAALAWVVSAHRTVGQAEALSQLISSHGPRTADLGAAEFDAVYARLRTLWPMLPE